MARRMTGQNIRLAMAGTGLGAWRVHRRRHAAARPQPRRRQRRGGAGLRQRRVAGPPAARPGGGTGAGHHRLAPDAGVGRAAPARHHPGRADRRRGAAPAPRRPGRGDRPRQPVPGLRRRAGQPAHAGAGRRCGPLRGVRLTGRRRPGRRRGRRSALVGAVHQRNTDRALAELLSRSAVTARVLRDGGRAGGRRRGPGARRRGDPRRRGTPCRPTAGCSPPAGWRSTSRS